MLGFNFGDGRCHTTKCTFNPEVVVTRAEMSPDMFYAYWTTTCDIGHLSQIIRLLGLKFSDPRLQSELWFLPFRVSEGPNGDPLIHCRCMGKYGAFRSADILSMLISHLKAERNEYLEFDDFPICVAVPIYFTDQQRNYMLEAAKVAGLSSITLLDETTAMILGYENSMLCARTLANHFPRKSIVAFIDIGYASTQICFAQFEMTYGPTSLHDTIMCTNILYQTYVRSLGGRDFTKVLFTHFASIIRKKYNIDVYESATACIRLSDACEDLKEKLSKHDEASFCIKEFSGRIDVKGSIKRKDFENMSAQVLKRIKEMAHSALRGSKLHRSKIQFVETIGNVSTMPAITNILSKVFRKQLKGTARSDSAEFVSRGCAIQSREKLWIGRQRTDLTRGMPTSELASIESSPEIKKAEDLERFLWRKAIDKRKTSEGCGSPLLTLPDDFHEMFSCNHLMHPVDTITETDNVQQSRRN